jgi:predicted  nucleic acid-binding Zn-ribbon protein
MPQTPRRKRRGTHSRYSKSKSLRSSDDNRFLINEIKILKKNQELMMKNMNRLNDELKELKKENKKNSSSSLPQGMYMGGGNCGSNLDY